MLSVDPDALPKDVDELQKLVAELCHRLKHEASEKDKYRSLLRELLDAQRNRKSEQLSKDQQALFETLWKANQPDEEQAEAEQDAASSAEQEQQPEKSQEKKRSGRYTSASEVVRDALRLLEEHEQVRMAQLAKFREEIDQRLASLERGEGLDGATVLAQLRHRSHARRQSHP